MTEAPVNRLAATSQETTSQKHPAKPFPEPWPSEIVWGSDLDSTQECPVWEGGCWVGGVIIFSQVLELLNLKNKPYEVNPHGVMEENAFSACYDII